MHDTQRRTVLKSAAAFGLVGGLGISMPLFAAAKIKPAANAALIVVDHDMHFVRMLEAQITVFNQGAILVEGTADNVLNDPRVREVYLGTRTR